MATQNAIMQQISKSKYFGIYPYFKQKNAQKFTALALTLIALSFFGFFAINPTLSTIAKLNKEIDDGELVYQQLEKKIIDLNSLKAQYVTLETDLPFVFDALPKTADVALLTAQIQAIGQNVNVRIKKIQQSEVQLFRKNKETEKYYSYAFSIAGAGSYENISQFVSSLLNMQRVINIDSLSIDKSTTLISTALEFNIKGIAFFKE